MNALNGILSKFILIHILFYRRKRYERSETFVAMREGVNSIFHYKSLIIVSAQGYLVDCLSE